MALTTLPTSWRLAVSFCEFCNAGQAIKTTKNIKPAIARTHATSMIVKPLIPPPHWVGSWVGRMGGMGRVGRVAQFVIFVVAVVVVFVVVIIIVIVIFV